MEAERSAVQLRRPAEEPDAFGGFYDGHFESLLSYLTRRTCDAEAGLDLTAETFAQGHRGPGRDPSQLGIWAGFAAPVATIPAQIDRWGVVGR